MYPLITRYFLGTEGLDEVDDDKRSSDRSLSITACFNSCDVPGCKLCMSSKENTLQISSDVDVPTKGKSWKVDICGYKKNA